MVISDNENIKLEEFNATMLLRSKSGDLYPFVLDFSANKYGANELVVNTATNV